MNAESSKADTRNTDHPEAECRDDTAAASLAAAFLSLVEIVARLRAPDGCPWDREQTHESIARNITEEAAETVDAIESGDLRGLREELGDLLLQVVLQSQIAIEADEFTLTEVIQGIADKLTRRHPHVFGVEAALDAMNLSPEKRQAFAAQAATAKSAEAVLDLWDNIKLLERELDWVQSDPGEVGETDFDGGEGSCDQPTSRPADQPRSSQHPSLLDSVPNALPALMQAQDISRKAISAGFDWSDVEAVWQQVEAEVSEFRAENPSSEAAADEFGDILFSLVNVGLKHGIDAESALRGTVRRFRQRWAIMEKYAHEANRELSSYTLEQQEQFWQQAKLELQE
ncbi:MAG: nucleoside triphosphate pyrophosphohydrolase [Coriobacteriia bacterium]|nr:nucleoside triphosphate pyrophosphohydrolase [Coriobacteriia bacterium]